MSTISSQFSSPVNSEIRTRPKTLPAFAAFRLAAHPGHWSVPDVSAPPSDAATAHPQDSFKLSRFALGLDSRVYMTGFRILLADASECLLQRYSRYFSDRGAVVQTANTGLQCISLLSHFHPQLLILDPELPWGGPGVLEWMSQNPEMSRVPVIVVTSPDNPYLISRIVKYPVTEVFFKPWAPESLARQYHWLECASFSEENQEAHPPKVTPPLK